MSQLIAQKFQARSSSRRFTGKPEQNITIKIDAKKDDGSAVWHAVTIRRDILEFLVVQCTLLKSFAMHSG